MVESTAHNGKVVGSIPPRPKASVGYHNSGGRVLECGSKRRGFKSHW